MPLLLTWMEQPAFEWIAPPVAAAGLRQEARLGAILGGPAAAGIIGSLFFVAEFPHLGAVGLVSIQEIAWRSRNCALWVFVDGRIPQPECASRRLVEAGLRYCFDEMDMRRVTLWDEAGGPLKELVRRLGAEHELSLPGYGVWADRPIDIVAYGVLQEAFYLSRTGAAPENLQ